jgi:uncharacterized protein
VQHQHQAPVGRFASYLQRFLGASAVQRRRGISGALATVSSDARSGDESRIRVRRFAGPDVYARHLDHLRVAHLTDQHFGRVTPMRTQRAAVAATNAERPHLVAITGDFVCHSQRYLGDLEETIRTFDAPVVAVLGNHDHWSGAPEVTRALRRAGALVLSNQSTVLDIAGQRLQVVGLDDAYTGHARRDDAVKGLRRDLPTLGLSHIAEEADGLWRHGVSLVLSGHTHAGHLTLARLHERAFGPLSGHRYVHGLYGSRRIAEGTAGGVSGPLGAVYVGAGIGASVVPVRLGDRAQPEVTVFELGCQPGSFDEHHEEQRPLAGRKPSARAKARRADAVVKNREERERAATTRR